jgi:transposase
MPIAGLDVHKRVVEAVVLSDDGKVVHQERFACDREELVRFAKKRLGSTARVVLEATTNTWSIVDILKPFVGEVVVSNPMRTRAIAEAKVKTDKVDALILAQLLRADFLPRVWQPDTGTQARRRLTNRRAGLVADRTRIKNRIHAVLHQRLIEPPVAELFGTKGLAWLRALDLDTAGRAAVDSELRMLDRLEKEIAAVHETLAVDGYDDARVRLLMTLPGIDVAVAQTVIAALGDIQRFRDGDHAASYVGLVPSTHQSADKCYHGPITKQGSAQARWMLVQAAQHIRTQPGPLGVFFRRLATKKNHNVAVVATARKLVVIAWHMLKNNEPYRYAVPRSVGDKLARHRIRATGQRRTTGPPKGQPPVETRGTGQRTRGIPSLDTLYEREGLPPLKPLSSGETRMLHDQELLAFHEQTRIPRRIPRPAAAKPSSPQTRSLKKPRNSKKAPA